MSETTNPPSDSASADVTAASHSQLVDQAKAAGALLAQILDKDLVSFSMVGHAIQEGLGKGELIESVLVVHGQLLDDAQRIGEHAAALGKHRLGPPLLMTDAYIKRSLDVFPIEYLHMQLLHRTVLGDDPFDQLKFEKDHVRLQCEREAKRYLLHIREGLMRSRGKPAALRQVMHELLAAVVPLFSAALYLKDAQRPLTRVAILGQMVQAFDFSASPFMKIHDDLTGRLAIPASQLVTTTRESYESLEKLSEWLDAV